MQAPRLKVLSTLPAPGAASGRGLLPLLLLLAACGAEAPLAVLEADRYQGLAPLVVRFDASQSSGPLEHPLTYAWDFGDGDQATEASPLHTYRGGGVFRVTLTVTARDLATRWISMLPSKVAAVFSSVLPRIR